MQYALPDRDWLHGDGHAPGGTAPDGDVAVSDEALGVDGGAFRLGGVVENRLPERTPVDAAIGVDLVHGEPDGLFLNPPERCRRPAQGEVGAHLDRRQIAGAAIVCPTVPTT